MTLAHLLATPAIRCEIADVICSHVIADKLGAFLVVSNELMPANAGAEVYSSADGVDENAISVRFGPSVIDPSYFSNFLDLRPSILTHISPSCVLEGVDSAAHGFFRVNTEDCGANKADCRSNTTTFEVAA